ncbi:MAG: PAS domain S-box protein [Methanobacteriaceae archaeon]|nr:PAS domain S-box protein [Methanobacteriaceae archaeon]
MSYNQKNNLTEEVFEGISDIFLSVDPNFRVNYVNNAAEKFFGVLKEDFIGKDILKAFKNCENDIFQDKLQLLHQKRSFEFESHFNTPNSDKWYQIRVFAYKNGFNIFCQDISSLKKPELELRVSEEKYRSLLNNIPDVVWTTSPSGETTFISSSIEKIYGYTPEEIYAGGNSLFFGRIHPEDIEMVKRSFENLFTKNELFDIEYRIKRKDGKWIWVHDHSMATYKQEGEWYADGILRDITHRKKMEKSLEESEKKYRSVIETAGEAIILLDHKGFVSEANQKALELTGFEKDELVGKSLINIAPLIKINPEEVLSAFEDVIHGRSLGKIQWNFTDRKNNEKTVILHYSPLKENNEIKGITLILEDVTELKKTEEAYRKRDQRWTNLISNLPGMAYRCRYDKNWTMEFVSHQCEEITGYKPSELINNSIIAYKELIFEEDRDHVWSTVQDAIGKNQPYETSYRIRTFSNEIKWVRERGLCVIEDEDLFIEGFIEDITEQKNAEELLKKSEENYRSIFENSIEGIFQSTPEGRYVSVNPSFARIAGFDSPKEMIGSVTNIKDLYVHPQDRENLIELLKHQDEVNDFQTEIKKKDGSVIWIKINVRAVRDEKGDLSYLQGSIIDITASKNAQETVRRSEEQLRLIIDSSHDFIYSYDRQGRFVSANKSLCDSMMISEDEIIGKTHEELGFPQDQCQEWNQLHQKVYRTNSTVTSLTTSIMPDGKIHDYEVVLNPLHDYNGNIIGISGITRDITERKKAEEALKESEDKYRTLFESDPDYTILLNLKGIILEVNNAAKQITGLSKEEIVGKHFMELKIFPPEELKCNASMFTKFLNGDDVKPYESLIYDKNGNIRWIEIKITSIKKNNTLSFILVICRDITDRKIVENKMKESLHEKEVLLKEVHHRVKNNMQIISSLLNLQKGYVEEQETVNVLVESQNRVKSMAMVHEKLYQSRDLTKINVPGYVKNLISDLFYSYAIKEGEVESIIDIENITFNMETAIPCGLIINELVSNSLKYAFTPGMKGKIVVSLQSKSEKFELIIADNGIGFPKTIDFKNTKSLGLQLVNSLVRQLDGEIKLDSGHGTKFTIKFAELNYKPRFNE